MLTRLTIQNIVLIDQLTITFQAGLCTLTGETGAGKSILLDALGLAVGTRAEARLVRAGQEQASVTAVFDVFPDHPVFNFLKEQDISLSGEELILRRTLRPDGRSKAYLNDQPISISLLAQIGAYLIEIHGQHDTQGLLDPSTHRAHLDQFAQHTETVDALKTLWHKWRSLEQEFEERQRFSEAARAEEEYLRQAIEDLDKLSPEENEEETLTELRSKLMNREQILEGLNTAFHALNAEHDPLSTAARALERIAEKAGEAIDAPLSAIERAQNEVQEALSLVQSISGDLSESEHNLQEIDERLFALKSQARKHQCSISELPQKRNELAAALNLIEAGDDALSELLKQVNAAKKAYITQAQSVSETRKRAAEELDRKVTAELSPLKLERAKFVTQVKRLEEADWSQYGIDQVRFEVATNPGATPGPLGKIASGGELSRFMLALKVVMAAMGTIPTMIFDEVDAGIGGATADAVGERLSKLGQNVQVLVVTHSPQVAARGAHHWIVHKAGNDKTVTTNITALHSTNDRREEIARMLSGAEITGEARRAAAKLLEGRAA